MPVLNRIADFAPEMAKWRHHLHSHPELEFDCHATAAFVADQLRAFGVDEIHQGIAQSGLVAIINGQGAGPTLGLRADMDALPISEMTGAAHASTKTGVMHACGHDGHMVMLLGAAKYLAETRRFAGRVALIFQPAEEEGGGGEVMVREGIMDRFDISQVYALHNAPNLDLGHFITTPGPIMAAVDTAYVTVTGRGQRHAFALHKGLHPGQVVRERRAAQHGHRISQRVIEQVPAALPQLRDTTRLGRQGEALAARVQYKIAFSACCPHVVCLQDVAHRSPRWTMILPPPPLNSLQPRSPFLT